MYIRTAYFKLKSIILFCNLILRLLKLIHWKFCLHSQIHNYFVKALKFAFTAQTNENIFKTSFPIYHESSFTQTTQSILSPNTFYSRKHKIYTSVIFLCHSTPFHRLSALIAALSIAALFSLNPISTRSNLNQGNILSIKILESNFSDIN